MEEIYTIDKISHGNMYVSYYTNTVQCVEVSGRQEYRMDWVRIPPDGKLKLMQTVDCRL